MKVLAAMVFLVASCGVDHDVNGGTRNTVTINIQSSTCDDERFTAQQKMKCLKLITKLEVDTNVSDLSEEELGILKEILDNSGE